MPRLAYPPPPDPDVVARRRAAALAGHSGDEAAAREAVDDPDGGVRATALGALDRLDALTPADVDRAAADAAPVVRARLAELAGRRDDIDPRPLLDDPDGTVVETAAWACGEGEGGPDVVAALIRVASTHDDPLCREAAVAALGALGDPDGLATILAATTDRPEIRRRAVLALAPFDGPEVDAALERALHDRDWQVRQVAEEMLGLPPGAGDAPD